MAGDVKKRDGRRFKGKQMEETKFHNFVQERREEKVIELKASIPNGHGLQNAEDDKTTNELPK